VPADRPALRDQVQAWIADDPDPGDQAELRGLLADGSEAAWAELADRFGGRLEFGTAGLRGAVAAGPNRMNRAVVRATTAALAQWLPAHQPGAAAAGVAIGCDARHRSGAFAAEAASVLAGAGIAVHLLPPQQPTPLLAFAVRHLHAAAGIMITASHNPPADNGYKLYTAEGAQIIPPADAEIEATIRGVGPLSQVPVAPPDSPLIIRYGDEVAAAYLTALTTVSPAAGPAGPAGAGVTGVAAEGGEAAAGSSPATTAPMTATGLRFVYTPLHGVAAGLALRAFALAGYPAPYVVPAQAEPDPDFPTVAFPNPEEPGALDLALDAARETGADLVVASDPDGDRLALAVPDPAAPGGWRTLTGDQTGALLGSYLLDRTAGQPDPGARLVVSTVVSGTLLARIAEAAGAQYVRTLTGFKWIVRGGAGHPGTRYLFGYEEALGYAVGDVVRDKDGIGAALAALGLAAAARAAGGSLLTVYDALESAHGVHLTRQVTLPTAEPGPVMAGLRARPPAALGGQPVLASADLSAGSAGLPPADLLRYEIDGARVVIRPSGTEPKIKAYLEVTEPPGRPLAQARASAAARMTPLIDGVRALLAEPR
jgi:phosphomannomutase